MWQFRKFLNLKSPQFIKTINLVIARVICFMNSTFYGGGMEARAKAQAVIP